MEKGKERNPILRALMDSSETISVYFEKTVMKSEVESLLFFQGDENRDYIIKYVLGNRVALKVPALDVKGRYFISYQGKKEPVIPHEILDSRKFQYHGNDLGVTYTKHFSVFKVFAPTATEVKLNLYEYLNGEGKSTYQLQEEEYGVWQVMVKGNLCGKFYAFNVFGALPEFRGENDVVDPYARCVIGKTNKAMIIDESRYERKHSLTGTFPLSKSIIYEIHVRDISSNSNSGAKQRGKFLALTKDNTSFTMMTETGNKVKVSTLLAHMKELGVNTIQIMPLQDFENEEEDENFYAWGYMPRFFFSPDGNFASDWKDDSKIRELKKMVKVFHENGLRVVLDVVYNHTAEGFRGDGIFSFNAFVPYFYYRFGNGHISNGSGCGNELRTESPMVRKFIIDSLIFWTDFYDFDGYRFDLMGLIDLETMKEIEKELRHYKNDIILYGEPWTGGLTPIAPTYKGAQKYKGFFVFNDDFRDAIKGAVFHGKDAGYIQSSGSMHYERVIEGILGSINTFAANPYETLNYVEVHDNHTLFDKLYYSLNQTEEFSLLDKENAEDRELLEKIKTLHKLAAFILLTSQGIPVLHLGQDFMRTKQGIENSYDSGDSINGIDWERKGLFYDVFTYYKNLIHIRKTNQLFTLTLDIDVRHGIEFRKDVFHMDNPNAIGYTLDACGKDYDGAKRVFVLINPYPFGILVDLKESGWKKLLFGNEYFKTKQPDIESRITVEQLSGAILIK